MILISIFPPVPYDDDDDLPYVCPTANRKHDAMIS